MYSNNLMNNLKLQITKLLGNPIDGCNILFKIINFTTIIILYSIFLCNNHEHNNNKIFIKYL